MQRQLQKSRLSFWSHHPSRSGTWPALQLSSTPPVEKERKSQIKLYKVKQRKNRRWRREKRWNGSSKGIMPKCTTSGVSACCLELSGTWERFFREGEIEQCWESSWCVYTCAFPATAVIHACSRIKLYTRGPVLYKCSRIKLYTWGPVLYKRDIHMNCKMIQALSINLRASEPLWFWGRMVQCEDTSLEPVSALWEENT